MCKMYTMEHSLSLHFSFSSHLQNYQSSPPIFKIPNYSFFTLSTISTLRPPQKTSTLLKTPVPSPSPSTLPASLYSPYQSSQPLNSGLNFRTCNLSVANVKYSKQNALTVFELVLENFAFTR